MAAGLFIPYENGVLNICNGNIDFANDTIKAALVDNAYTPAVTTHDAWDDVSANECNVVTYPDYAAITMGTNTIAIVSNKVVFDGANLDWGDAVTISARYVVFYKDSGTPATSYLFGYVDLNDGGSANVSSTSSDFDLAFSASGLYRITP